MYRVARAPRIPSIVAALLVAALACPMPIQAAPPGASENMASTVPLRAASTTATLVTTSTAPSGVATKSVEPTKPPAAVVEQNNGRLVYFGTWTDVANPAASSGSYRVAAVAGSTLHATFSGTRITWTGPVGPAFGRAEVYVDDVRVATVDQRGSISRQKRAVWTSKMLPSGKHTLEIRVLAPVALSGGTQTGVDSLVVDGALAEPSLPVAYARVEEGDARLTYFGSWKRTANSAASSGTVRVSTTNGSGALVAFRGSAITLVGPVGRSYGRATVYLDGKQIGTLNQYATSERARQPLWSAIGLADQAHVIEVRPAVAASASTNVGAIALDAIWMKGRIGQAPKRLEEGSSQLGTSGTWVAASSSTMSGGRYLRSVTGGSAIAARFSGTSVRVLGLKSPNSGEIEVVVDGTPRGTLSLYSPSTLSQQTLYSLSGLAQGTHEIEVRALGTAAAGSKGVGIGIDAFEVQGTPLDAPVPSTFSLAEEDDADFAFLGSWRSGNISAMSSGAYAYSQMPGSELSAVFTGTGIRVIGPRATNYGKIEIIVDGASRGVVNQFGSARLYRQHLWSVTGLSAGQHNLTLRVLDSRDSRGSVRPVAIDAFEVVDGALVTAPRPAGVARAPENDSRVIALGQWSPGAGAVRAGDTEVLTGDARSRYDVKFTGSAVSWIGQRGPNRGMCQVLVDGNVVRAVDLYAPVATTDRVLFSASEMGDGEHVLSIRASGRRNRLSSSFVFGVGAIEVAGQLVDCAARFEESDWRLVYSGGWTSRLTTAASAGSMRAADATAATLSAAFSGTSVALLAEVGPAAGIASITVDGGTAVEVDLYAAQAEAREQVLALDGLAPGEHVIVIACTGRANPAAIDNKVAIDAFDIDGTLLPQTASQKARQAAVDTAIAQLGKKYVWAGVGPTVFDCSGLMLFSYRAAGISLPHYSGSQWGLCTPKRLTDLEPGDLCFDDGPGRIHHVGMYIGDGITINAPGSGRYVEYRSAASYGCFGKLKLSLWPK